MASIAARLWVALCFSSVASNPLPPAPRNASLAYHFRTGGVGEPVVIALALTLDCCSAFHTHGHAIMRAMDLFMETFMDLRGGNGGIYVDGPDQPPRPLELRIMDDKSDPSEVTRIYNQFVSEGVKLFMGPYTSGLNRPASAIVHAAGALQIAQTDGFEPNMNGRPYVFGCIPRLSSFLAGPLESIAKTAAPGATVSYLFESSQPMPYICDAAPSLVNRSGMTLKGAFPIGGGTEQDLEKVLEDISKDPPDVLIGCTWPVVAKSLAIKLMAMRLPIKAYVSTKILDAREGLGEPGRHAIGAAHWLPDVSTRCDLTGWTNLEFSSRYKQKFGAEPTSGAALGFSGLALFTQAIESARSDAPATLASWLQTAHVNTVYGTMAFDANGLNTKPFMAAQIDADGTSQAVFPPSLAAAELVYPMAPWEHRPCLQQVANSRYGFGADNSCVQCSDGAIGEWDNITQTRHCVACPLGTNAFYEQDGSKAFCEDCHAGSYGNESSLSQCLLCDSGRFSSAKGKTVCDVCLAGFAQEFIGKSSCGQCAPGTFASSNGSTRCELCDVGSYAAQPKSITCVECGEGLTTPTIGSRRPDLCVCKKGTYFKCQGDECRLGQVEKVACSACPAGAECIGPEASPNAMITASGDTHKRPHVPATFMSIGEKVYMCAGDGSACPGATMGSDNICAHGGEGVACSLCLGTLKWNGNRCEECGATTGPAIVVVILIILICWLTTKTFAMESGGKFTQTSVENLVRNDLVATPFALYLNLVQTAWVLAKVKVSWPGSSGGMLHSQGKIFDLDMLDFGCMGDDPRSLAVKSAWFLNISPAFVFLTLLVLWSVGTLFKKPVRLWPVPERAISLAFGVLTTLFTAITNVAVNIAFSKYAHPTGEFSLVKTPFILDSDPEVQLITIAAVFGISLWVVGGFSVVLWSLLMLPRRLDSPYFLRSTIGLTIKYQKQTPWWDIVMLLRKLLCALSVSIFTDGRWQFAFMGMVLVVYLVALLIFAPYRERVTHYCDVTGSTGLVLVMIAMVKSDTDSEENLFLPLLVLLTYIFAGSFAFYAVYLSILARFKGLAVQEVVAKSCLEQIPSYFLRLLPKTGDLSGLVGNSGCAPTGKDPENVEDMEAPDILPGVCLDVAV